MTWTVPDLYWPVYFRFHVGHARRLLRSVSIHQFDRLEFEMETIRGKTSLDMDINELTVRLTNYKRVVLDLGTGDGRYVHSLAESDPRAFIIGVDSCRENLRAYSRAKLPNMLFIIASAQWLPHELNGLVSHITVNFPWGSLLESLLNNDARLMCGLESIASSAASIDVRLNSGALTEAGWSLEAGAERIYDNISRSGWQVNAPALLNAGALRSFPSTWAKRLVFGRDPRAVELNGYFVR
jgi:predicted RNA methylase